MGSISGVQLKKNSKSKTTHVVIDVRKHPEIISVLKEKGLMPKTPLQIEAENGYTVDEVFDEIQQKITDFYANRHLKPTGKAEVK